jgi:hypothetical protein
MDMTDYPRLVAQARTKYALIWDNPRVLILWPVPQRIFWLGNRLIRLGRELPDGRLIGYDEYSNTLVVTALPVPHKKDL